jgi:hypothetical protein
MKDSEMDRFDEALRVWANQVPQTPADEAARQVLARLPERRRGGWLTGSQLRLATAGVVLALLLVIGWATLPQSPVPLSASEELAQPPMSEDVVLLWLDSETPLYLTVATSATKGGSQ